MRSVPGAWSRHWTGADGRRWAPPGSWWRRAPTSPCGPWRHDPTATRTSRSWPRWQPTCWARKRSQSRRFPWTPRRRSRPEGPSRKGSPPPRRRWWRAWPAPSTTRTRWSGTGPARPWSAWAGRRWRDGSRTPCGAATPIRRPWPLRWRGSPRWAGSPRRSWNGPPTSLPERDRGVAWMAILRCPESRREELVATLERTSAEALALLAMDHMSSPDAAERALALTLAGRAGRPETVRGIAGALQDPTPQVRRVAARALTSLRSSDAIPALGRALSDPDLEVRIAAVQALSMIDDDDVLDPLIAALKDPEVRVREVAGEALVRWRSPAVARR